MNILSEALNVDLSLTSVNYFDIDILKLPLSILAAEESGSAPHDSIARLNNDLSLVFNLNRSSSNAAASFSILAA